MSMTRSAAAVAFAWILTLAGCTETNENDASADGTINQNDSGNDSNGIDSGSDVPAMSLGDAQIVSIAMTAATGEIQEGQLAMTHATNSTVQSFATMLVDHHTAANTMLMALGIAPQDNAISMQLQSTVAQQMSNLQTLTGSAFDTQYVNYQLRDHMTALMIFDQMLIPNAQNATLRTQLTTMRAAIQMHLQMAQALAADGGA